MQHDPATIKVVIRDVLTYLSGYFKNPVQAIREIPQWSWSTVAIFHLSFALFGGTIAGIVGQSFRQTMFGIFLFPISSAVVTIVLCGFFYYAFLFFLKKEIKFIKIVTLVVLANVPFMLLYTMSEVVPPINLLGFAVTGMLILVGSVENFGVSKKPMIRLLIGMYSMYAIVWIIGAFNFTDHREKEQFKASPKSLEILERELQGD